MANSTKASPRDYGRLFLVLGHIVGAGFVLLLLATIGAIGRPFGSIGVSLVVVAIMTMFSLRRSDEWIASLWSAGANAGFIAAIVWLMLLPITEGFIDGLIGSESKQDLGPEGASIAALGCFLIALYLKRLRGY
jgi:hypothetical protein